MNNEQLMKKNCDSLNQKGYIVTSSELASYEENTIIRERVTKSQCSKLEFMTWINQYNLKLLSEDETYYYYESKILGKKGHITFASDVILPSYPTNFEYEKSANRLSYIIDYYQDENYSNKKSKEEFELETRNYLDQLHTWLNNLEERNAL